MGVFIPTHAKRYQRRVEGACSWCCKWQPLKVMCKARDGPLDHYFCSPAHCEEWGDARRGEHSIVLMGTSRERVSDPSLRAVFPTVWDAWLSAASLRAPLPS